MIGTVTLGRSPLATSQLGFGTSRLHYIDTENARADILALAADLGLRHIDTAPAYGDGLAERTVGQVFRRRRNSVIVATKAGLSPNPLSDRFPVLGGVVRACRVASRLARIPKPGRQPITPAAVRSSLEASLRRLGFSYVDVLFLHEPSPSVIPDPDGVLNALLMLRRDGLARHIGIAGDWEGIAALGEGFLSESLLIQTHADQWREKCPPDICYGVLSRGPQAFGAAGRVAPADAKERLLRAFSRQPRQTVLVSTTNQEHLRSLGALASETL